MKAPASVFYNCEARGLDRLVVEVDWAFCNPTKKRFRHLSSKQDELWGELPELIANLHLSSMLRCSPIGVRINA